MTRAYEFLPVEQIPNVYKRTKNQQLLEDFLASGMPACELKINDTAKKPASNLRSAAKHFSLPVTVISRHDKIYLIRREI